MLDTGTYGAKVQSWKKENPRDLLKQLIEENPSMDKPALLSALREELLAEDHIGYLYAVIEYWFSNNYHSLVEARAAPKSRVSQKAAKVARQAKVAAIKEKVQERIHEEAKIILLDMILPTGKALRDSTGDDCARAGGWFARIAEQVNPDQTVGAVMSEDQLRDLWSAR